MAIGSNEMVNDRVIIGIDPGSNIMGYGVLHHKGKDLILIAYGIERFEGEEEHLMKIKKIFERVIALIEKYLPDEMAIEAPFYGKNIQSMLKLGRAQGAAISAALSREIPVVEYSPKRVKMSVTGKGNATKEQVAYMMTKMLKMSTVPETFDATDAIAIALCHFNSRNAPVKSSKSWGAFLKENPERMK
jgi:crossover junction endodeoxyribonuclease RuvC